IILFDGVCNLCDASVRFVISHDKHDRFRFAPLQSATGAKIAAKYDIIGELSTFYLIEGGRAYQRSDAWLRIMYDLGGVFSAAYVLYFIPRTFRDWIYDLIGRNRYQWFGKKEYCEVVDPKSLQKFLT
ncbi:MAG: thiol-disulfide oxidoreductase DCC family protein, partial [Methylococcales bacterium]